MLSDFQVALLLIAVFAAAGFAFVRVAKSCRDSKGRPIECDLKVPGRDAQISDVINEDP
jgi:hypothetical protein